MTIKISYPSIPLDANHYEHTDTWGETNYINKFENNISGPKSSLAVMRSNKTGLSVSNLDLGVSTKAIDHVIIGNANLLRDDDVTRLSIRGARQSAFTPNKISGLQLWLEPSRGVTANSKNRVSAWVDSSSNAYTASPTSTDTNGFILTRADNQENALTYSQQFTNAAWDDTTTYGVYTTDNFTNDYAGSQTAAKLLPFAGAARRGIFYSGPSSARYLKLLSTDIYIIEIDIKKGNYDYAWIGDQGDSIWHGINVNLATGSFIGLGNGITSKTITSLGNSWYRVSLTCTASSDFYPSVGVWFGRNADDAAPTNAITYAGTEEIYIARAQLRRSGTDSTYITTTEAPQIAGIGGNRCMYLDGNTRFMKIAPTANINNLYTASASVFIVQKVLGKFTGTNFALLSNEDYNISGFIIRVNGATGYPYLRVNRSGALDELTGTTVLTRSQTQAIGYVKSSTSGTHYLDGASSGTGTINNGAAATLDLNIGSTTSGALPYYGFICEILAYSKALDSTERAQINEYLADKWQAQPVIYSNDLDAETLINNDLVKTCSTSTAYRHWWLEMESDAASKFPHSKLFMGQWLDFGETINNLRCERKYSESTIEFSDMGNPRLIRGKKPPLEIQIEWKGLTDDQVIAFESNVVNRSTNYNSFYLYSDKADQLNGETLVYCKLVNYSINGRDAEDYNTISATFEEIEP